MLSFQLEKQYLWDDPVHAGRISREHGTLMGKMKEVNGLEQGLLEHINMIKLAREEDDPDHMESESVKALLKMRQSLKEKELLALLAGEHDSCSCYIEPYRIVKDLHINFEVSDPDSVLEGEIYDFILSFLTESMDRENDEA